MKSFIKKIAAVLLCVAFLLISVCGCGKNNAQKSLNQYVENSETSIGSSMISQNNRYSLFWDDDKKCVLFTDKSNKSVWSNVPYSYYKLDETSGVGAVRMYSAINVEYLVDDGLKQCYSYVEANLNGEVIAQKSDDSLIVTYYMSNLQISIPVEYSITDEGMQISVLIDKIREKDNLVYSVTVAPFMCSVLNNSKNSYLFVPSGCGTIMFPDEEKRNIREFSGYVYGEDFATTSFEKIFNEEKIYLPVFGAVSENDAVCGIITEGAEISRIDAQAGNIDFGYSSVCNTFILRGSNNLLVTNAQGVTKCALKNTDDIINLKKATILYKSLKGEKANYCGIADAYRDYLIKKYNIQATQNSKSEPLVRLLGGALTKSNVFGISVDKLKVATSFDSAREIVSDFKSQTGTTPCVELLGFGSSGLDNIKIAGGSKFSNKFGKFSEFKNYCNNEKINLFADFDIINYKSGGNGVSKYKDCATTSNKVRANQYYFSPENYAKIGDAYSILKRTKLEKISNSVISFAKKSGVSGVCFSSLSNQSYSDYPDNKTYNKNGFCNIAVDIIENVKKNDITFYADNAFDYVAAVSDYLVSSPTKSAEYDGFDLDIPFYQLVFKGIKPIYVSSVNLSVNPQKQFLKAIETGCPLSFTFCGEYDTDFSNSLQSVFQFSIYKTWKDEVVKMCNSSKDYFDNVSNLGISSHEALAKDLFKTVFTNGSSVYVNYSDKDFVFGSLTIPKNNYVYEIG